MRLKEGPTHVAKEYRPSGSGTVTFLAVGLPLIFFHVKYIRAVLSWRQYKSSNNIRQLGG